MQKASDERTGKNEMTQEELEQFRDFFTTSVAQVPEEMTGRVQEKKPKISGGLFQRLFHKGEEDGMAAGGTGELTLPTGEVLLDDELDEDGDMVLQPVEPASEPAWEDPPAREEPALEQELALEPVDEPLEEPAGEPEPPAPVPGPAEPGLTARSGAAAEQDAPRPKKPAAPAPEDQGLLEFKELLDAMREGRPSRAEKPAEPEPVLTPEPAPVPEAQSEPPLPAVKPFIAGIEEIEEAPAAAAQTEPDAAQAEPDAAQVEQDTAQAAPNVAQTEPDADPSAVLAAEPVASPSVARSAAPDTGRPSAMRSARPAAEPAGDTREFPEVRQEPAQAAAPQDGELSKKDRWDRLFQMFGAGEDEAPVQPAPDAEPQKEDTLSLPLLAVEEEPAAEPPQAPAEPEAPARDTETAQEAAAPVADRQEEPQGSEEIGQNLRHMGARLTLRCALSGILAAALLGLGLMAEGLLPATAALDPVDAPMAFMGANLLLLLVAAGVSFGILREGLAGLFGRPSADSLPAVATVAALVQAVAALLEAQTYRASNLTLMSGMAALLLFMSNLGSRIRLAAVQGNYELIACGVEHSGAYRVRDRDLIRCLAEGTGEKEPWILLSRPVQWASDFIEQSFSERASERMARRMARILAVAGLLSGVVILILGRGMASAASAMATMVCLGAPLSVTLVAGLSSLRMQRSAGAVGAVVPGWAAVEELGGIDTVQVDARDLFTPECAQLEDIRMFKGGRIDKAILYTASVLSQGCNTLSGLFRQIIAEQTDILLPVKDLEKRRGLGFVAWCDNCRVLVGTREMMEQEGVALPEQEYEDKHSHNGELQILYLAVSGSLHAMFVLKYVGGRHAARGLAVLQRENVRLLVACDDPTLTAQRISEVYRLPEGLVRVMTEEQCRAVTPAVAYTADAPCCMVHLHGFASLTGGLRAAARAQTAEQSGTTVQLVSVCISVVIGLLLTYAGSIGSLSLMAVLMYQAAWSALSLALTVLKQH